MALKEQQREDENHMHGKVVRHIPYCYKHSDHRTDEGILKHKNNGFKTVESIAREGLTINGGKGARILGMLETSEAAKE
jgi:hypothetical protein